MWLSNSFLHIDPPISSILQVPNFPFPPTPPLIPPPIPPTPPQTLKVRYRNDLVSVPYFFNTSSSSFPFPPTPPLIPPPTPPTPNPKGKITVQISCSPSTPHPHPNVPTHPTPNPKSKKIVMIFYIEPLFLQYFKFQVPLPPPTPPINRPASDGIIGSEVTAKYPDEKSRKWPYAVIGSQVTSVPTAVPHALLIPCPSLSFVVIFARFCCPTRACLLFDSRVCLTRASAWLAALLSDTVFARDILVSIRTRTPSHL